jgi:Uncharacterized conserved protein
MTIILAGCICFLLSGCKAKDNKPLHLVKKQSIENAIANIRVNWTSGHVYVLKSKDHNIHIEQAASTDIPDKNLFTSSVENRTLNITDNNIINWQYFTSGSTDLKLYCPEESFDSVSLLCTSGEIKGENLHTKQMDVESTSADIDVSGVFESVDLKSISGSIYGKMKAKSLDVKSTSGNMDVNGTFQTMRIKSISGDPQITCIQIPKTITTSTTSGNVVLNLPRNNGFTLSFKSTSGKLKSNIVLKQNNQIYKNGSSKIAVNTTSGDLEIHQAS